MKHVVLVFVLLSGLFGLLGCGTQPSATPSFVSIPPQRPADVLILSPQGVAPDRDTVGFNTLVKNVTQSFAEELGFLLVEKNVSYVNVIDQRPEFDAGQKMALNGVYFDANVVLMLEVITETLGADEQLLLKVSYMDIEKIKEGDKVTGLKPTSMVSRSYLLRSSVSGDNPKTTLDLAYDFMAYLQAQGKFKE